MSFKDFNFDLNIYKAIKQCGYTDATPIQANAIPVILEGKDIIATAQTGTGKTAAFVLPMLQQLQNMGKSKSPSILILSPTRELAMQISKAANDYGRFMKFNIINLVGGMPYPPQIRDLERGADIIVATPGRLIDHIENHRVNLSKIKTLILDEADRMLDMGFIEDIQYVSALTPKERQTLLFSATFEKRLAQEVQHLLNKPVRIDLSEKLLAAPKIKQTMYRTNSMHQKTKLLKHFMHQENMYKAIIFSATKMHADKLAADLRQDGFAAAALHGDLRQNVRRRTVEQLRNGKVQYLIATDVAARGLDINDVTHVVNYDLPRFCEDYVHRIGRTGRAGKEGVAISFVSSADQKHAQRIERYLGQRIKFVNNVKIDDIKSDKEPFDVESLNERHGGGGRQSRGKRSGGGFSGGKKRFSDSGHSGQRSGERKRYSDDSRSEKPNRERKRFSDDNRNEKSNGEKKRFSDDNRSERRGGERKRFSDDSRSERPNRERKRFSDDSRSERPSRERKRFSDDNRKDRPKRERMKFSDENRGNKSSTNKKSQRHAKKDGNPFPIDRSERTSHSKRTDNSKGKTERRFGKPKGNGKGIRTWTKRDSKSA